MDRLGEEDNQGHSEGNLCVQHGYPISLLMKSKMIFELGKMRSLIWQMLLSANSLYHGWQLEKKSCKKDPSVSCNGAKFAEALCSLVHVVEDPILSSKMR